MNVQFQVKVPIDIAIDLKERLRILTESHEQEVEKLHKKLVTKQSDDLLKKLAELEKAGRLLTMNNLVRVAITHGAANVVLMKDEVVLQHLTEIGLTRGRPRS